MSDFDKMMMEFQFKRLNTPCHKCGRMPSDHPYCNCLVNGCIGYQCNDYCRLPPKDHKLEEWISVWDRRAIVQFHGPIRTATGHIHEYRSDGKCKFCEIENKK